MPVTRIFLSLQNGGKLTEEVIGDRREDKRSRKRRKRSLKNEDRRREMGTLGSPRPSPGSETQLPDPRGGRRTVQPDIRDSGIDTGGTYGPGLTRESWIPDDRRLQGGHGVDAGMAFPAIAGVASPTDLAEMVFSAVAGAAVPVVVEVASSTDSMVVADSPSMCSSQFAHDCLVPDDYVNRVPTEQGKWLIKIPCGENSANLIFL